MQTQPPVFGSPDFDVLKAAHAIIACSAAALLPAGHRAAPRPTRLVVSRACRPPRLAAATAALRQSDCASDH